MKIIIDNKKALKHNPVNRTGTSTPKVKAKPCKSFTISINNILGKK